MKKILMVALEFPPCHSSGVQRTFKFAEYLHEMGWDPIILTADTNAYQHVEKDFKIPMCLEGKIYRVPCLNLKKAFSIRGKYPGIVEYFDKYWPWYLKAVPKGLELIKALKPDVIWSTYPVITAHLIGYRLSKKTNLPWIMDYRDPIRQHYDSNYINANHLTFYLERKMINHCSKAIFTTNRAVDFYKSKYPLNPDKFRKISNGYSVKLNSKDESNYKDSFIVLHSGVLYDEERDITPLVYAIKKLTEEKFFITSNVILRFRGANPSRKIRDLIEELNVLNHFDFQSSVSFEESVQEMSRVNAFLLVQSDKFCNQVPGKLYEYCQFEKPIVILCSKNSATYDEVSHLDNSFFVTSVNEIVASLKEIIQEKKLYTYDTEQFSRFAKSRQLVDLLNEVQIKK